MKENDKLLEQVEQIMQQMENLQQQLQNLREEISQKEEAPPEPEAPVAPPPITLEETVESEEQMAFKPYEPEWEKTDALGYEENALDELEPETSSAGNAEPGRGNKWRLQMPTDWEKFIGENLVNKIGIAILTIGIAIFVKFAIDKDWIGPVGRVFIGLLAGGILLGVAHYLRKSYKAFSSVLLGGGIATLYFTIAIAFHEYQLFSQTMAFIIMVGITAFTVFFSLAYDRREIAVLAVLGGFSTPFIVSTGSGNYVVLFTYLLILDVGMMVLAYFKKWHILNYVCYLSTVLIFGAWMTRDILVASPATEAISWGLIFSTAFFLVFFFMNTIYNIRQKMSFGAIEITLLLSNSFFYFAAGMILMDHFQDGQFKGAYTAVVAVFHFLFAFIFYRNKNIDRNLVILLIGLVLTFATLVAPIQLEGNYITLFWAAEALILLLLYRNSRIALLQVTSIVVTLLMLVSLVMDWMDIYRLLYLLPEVQGAQYVPARIIANKAFITSVAAVISLFVSRLWMKQEKPEDQVRLFTLDLFANDSYLRFLLLALVAVIYLGGYLELSYQLTERVENQALGNICRGIYNLLAVLIFYFYAKTRKRHLFLAASYGLIMLCILYYLLYLHREHIEFRNFVLVTAPGQLPLFFLHFINVALVATLAVLLARNMLPELHRHAVSARLLIAVLVFFGVFILSSELDHIVLMIRYRPAYSMAGLLNQVHKIGYPILWGVTGLIMIITGMSHKILELRVAALILFAITLLKLFIFDIKDVSDEGKIAAFICLGIVLLIISFLYQKLRRLLIDEKSEPAENAPIDETA